MTPVRSGEEKNPHSQVRSPGSVGPSSEKIVPNGMRERTAIECKQESMSVMKSTPHGEYL
jgi:hypothetical protein